MTLCRLLESAGFVSGLSLAFAVACAPVPHVPRTQTRAADVLVLAPHPDDETLLAAGVLADAVHEGKSVVVVIVTNGDFTCQRDGYLRQRESVAAMAKLGVPESSVRFLGYPDGWLAEMGHAPLSPVSRRDANGVCGKGAVTYGARGFGGADEHTRRTGSPAPYTMDAASGDLAAILTEVRPRNVYVAHGIDAHPDHAGTYALLRRAVESSDFVPDAIHRGVVHAGPCWPCGSSAAQPCDEVRFSPTLMTPPLPVPRARYLPNERRRVPDAMRSEDVASNTKLLALLEYRSQLGTPALTDRLIGFVRPTEDFYAESLVRTASGRYERAPAKGIPAEPARGTEGCDSYAVRVDRAENRVLLIRRGPEKTAAETRLAHWLVPAEALGAGEPLALTLDPRPDDGGVLEIALRWRGEFLALSVDAEPPANCVDRRRELTPVELQQP